ncbi:hypothetical protein GCM10027447_18230 [Glycomyces halotolerans]
MGDDEGRGIGSLGDQFCVDSVGEHVEAHRPKSHAAERSLESATVVFETQVVWKEKPRHLFTGQLGIGGSEDLVFGERDGIFGEDLFEFALVPMGFPT